MKLHVAIASASLALAFIATASAQRGGAARGGFSARSAPSFHSSFAPSSRSFSGPAYRYSGPSFAPATRITSAPRIITAPRFSIAPSAARPAFYSQHRQPVTDRRRYAPGIGLASPYAYPFAYTDYGWFDPGYIDPGHTDAVPYDQASAQPTYPDPSLQQEPAAHPLANSPRYAPPRQPAPPEEEAVTLVFKDGRPSEQIHNYMLTRTMLYVQDQHRRDIPVDQLDLAATEKANQSNGVEFALPTGN